MLLEVILATAVMAIAGFGLINSLGRCLSAARSVQNYGIAQNLLANIDFELRVERATDMLEQEGEFEDYPGFTWSRTFEAVEVAWDDTEIRGLWKETIAVSWPEHGQLRRDEIVQYRYLPEKQ